MNFWEHLYCKLETAIFEYPVHQMTLFPPQTLLFWTHKRCIAYINSIETCGVMVSLQYQLTNKYENYASLIILI